MPVATAMTETRFRQAFLILLVIAISAAFVAMIQTFLLTILLAAIFAGLSYPVYQWVLRGVHGRKPIAAIATLLLLLALVMAPLLGILGAGANEALRVTETIRPRLQQLVSQPDGSRTRLAERRAPRAPPRSSSSTSSSCSTRCSSS